jgi:hypothetical protein
VVQYEVAWGDKVLLSGLACLDVVEMCGIVGNDTAWLSILEYHGMV